jgi:hypothetical protein
MKRSWILLFSLLAAPALARAAACCGGGSAAPALINSDDKAQLTSSYGFTEVYADNVDSRGVWYRGEEHQRIQTLRIEGAHVFGDRWQAGFALPVLQRTQLEETHSGLGDVSGQVGYEYLPDWDYNPYRPKGIGYLQLVLPTGKSRAESDNGGLDTRGNGFWALGAGTLLSKTISVYDVFFVFETHRSFAKNYSNSQAHGELKPGFGGNLGLGAGYNLKDFRIGAALTWTYEDPVKVKGTIDSPGESERYGTAALSLSYLANDHWTVTGTYSDQTLIGSPVNTSLGKTVAVLVQRRWAR